MPLADRIQTDLETVFFNTDEFAKTVDYTHKSSGVVKTIKAIVNYGAANDGLQHGHGFESDSYTAVLFCERDLRLDFTHGNTRQSAYVTVMLSDIPDPEYRDTIEIDGVTWRVAEVYDHA